MGAAFGRFGTLVLRTGAPCGGEVAFHTRSPPAFAGQDLNRRRARLVVVRTSSR